jgi:hypothetical protein
MDNIKLVVTPASFDEHFSIDEWFNFSDLTQKEMYEKMLLFVVDAEGNSIDPVEARKLFRKVKKAEWGDYIIAFYKAVNDAFVNPTKGDSLSSQLPAEPQLPPDGLKS